MDTITSDRFSKHINELLDTWHTPGAAVAVAQNGKVESKGFGKAALDPAKPVTADTLFDIASSSKSLTAASVALLVADNERYPQMQWDSKMSNLLPEDFVMAEQSYTDDITVEDILCHRTGLPSHDSSYLGIHAKHPDTPQSVTRNLRNLPLAAPIRTRFMYNNMMFTVATHLVEKLSGQTFSNFLHTNFFHPLSMTSTHLQPNAAIAAGLKGRMATNHCWIPKREILKPVPWEQTPEAQGAGSIFTSVNDYMKWVQALMNQESPITDEIYKALTRTRTIQDPDGGFDELNPKISQSVYALGLEIFWYRGYKVIKHDGLISGSASCHFFVPEVKLGGVVLANSSEGGAVAEIVMMEVIDEAIDIPEAERPDWNDICKKREERYKSGISDGDDLRKNLCPHYNGTCEPQKIPLSSYTGEYWNAGYHGMKVEVRDDKLFVDATDRSAFGFTLTFEHVCGQTMYIAHLVGTQEEAEGEIEAEFRFDNDRVVKMGIRLEDDLEGMIWFDKVE